MYRYIITAIIFLLAVAFVTICCVVVGAEAEERERKIMEENRKNGTL